VRLLGYHQHWTSIKQWAAYSVETNYFYNWY